MKFMLLTNDYSGFQSHIDGPKLVMDWYGPIDFTGVEFVGLSNVHVFPLRFRKNPYSAVISTNVVQPTLYNPQKVLSTIRVAAHTDHTPLCNFKGGIMSHRWLIKQIFRSFSYRPSTNRSHSHNDHRFAPARDYYQRSFETRDLYHFDSDWCGVDDEQLKENQPMRNPDRTRLKNAARGAKNVLKIVQKICLYLLIAFRICSNNNTS